MPKHSQSRPFRARFSKLGPLRAFRFFGMSRPGRLSNNQLKFLGKTPLPATTKAANRLVLLNSSSRRWWCAVNLFRPLTQSGLRTAFTFIPPCAAGAQACVVLFLPTSIRKSTLVHLGSITIICASHTEAALGFRHICRSAPVFQELSGPFVPARATEPSAQA